MMAFIKSCQSAVASFHSAIDYEQENNYEEAYKKYTEGLSMISTTLKNDVHLFSQPHMINMHKQMLEFAKRSVDRLLIILEKIAFNKNSEDNKDENHNPNYGSTYEKLSESLSGIVSYTPIVSFNFPDEIPGIYSPLSAAEEDNKRMIKMYKNRIDSLMNSTAKANLQLQLQRRLAENDVIAKKRYEHWENQRKTLAEECQRIAQEKFFIPEKIKTGSVNDTDFMKQNLYAACLQYHKEHTWAQESSFKLSENVENENYIKRLLTFFLLHGTHPLACILRQLQQKVINKLSKVHTYQSSFAKHEGVIVEEHFKNIVQDSKEDLFTLTTVIQALWEPLNTESNQTVVIDVLHHLYFPTVKPYFIQLLRIILRNQEEELENCMAENAQKMIQYPSSLNPIISKLHQLSLTHSPSTMMIFLVEILKSLIAVFFGKNHYENFEPLSVGVDEIMPNLIQLILICNMSTLPAEISFVENFMPAKKALGEEGYAVTLFQSVLLYIYNNSNTLNTIS